MESIQQRRRTVRCDGFFWLKLVAISLVSCINALDVALSETVMVCVWKQVAADGPKYKSLHNFAAGRRSEICQ